VLKVKKAKSIRGSGPEREKKKPEHEKQQFSVPEANVRVPEANLQITRNSNPEYQRRKRNCTKVKSIRRKTSRFFA